MKAGSFGQKQEEKQMKERRTKHGRVSETVRGVVPAKCMSEDEEQMLDQVLN